MLKKSGYFFYCSCDVIVYDATNQKAANVTNRNQDRSLTLCLMNEDHYDVVHQKEHIQNAGFCQCKCLWECAEVP